MEIEQAQFVYPASIIKALCKIMGDCGTVKKSGKNKFHNYDYATDEDLVGMVRPLMAKHGLVLIPSLAGMPQVEAVQTKNGTATHVSIMMEYTLASVSEDGKTGEVWPEKIRTFGEAIDNGDKGFYKASTGANKYTIFRLFQLAAGDDTERDSHERVGNGGSQSQRPAAKSAPVAEGSGIWNDPKVMLAEIRDMLISANQHGELEETWSANYQAWFKDSTEDQRMEVLEMKKKIKHPLSSPKFPRLHF